MAKPKITYGHGWLTDCSSTTGWVETEDGSVGSLSVLNGDFFRLWVTSASGNKVYYNSYPDESGDDNLALDSNIYSKIVFKYKTSDTTMKAKIVIVFAGGTTQTILVETSNTSYTSGSVDITPNKMIDHVRLYANQGVGSTYYDFVLLCQGQFQFPMVSGELPLKFEPRIVHIPIPGRLGDITQYIGEGPATIEIESEMHLGDFGSPLGVNFYQILHALNTEPWQWFENDYPKIKCKVSLTDLQFVDRGKPHIKVQLKEYRLSNASVETYSERFGL